MTIDAAPSVANGTKIPLHLLVLPVLLTACSAAPYEDWVPVYEEPRHRLAFENDDVMVLNVNLPPGYVSLFHEHRLDLLYVTVSGTRVWSETPGGERGGADVPTGDLRFSSDNHPLPHVHRVGNSGEAPFHLIGVGVKNAAGTTPPLAGDLAGMLKVAERENAVVYRIDLAPGEQSGDHRHDTPYTEVHLTGGSLRDEAGNVQEKSAGDFLWHPEGTTHRYENAGDTSLVIVEVLSR